MSDAVAEPARLSINGAIATITLDRPAAFNAINLAIAQRLEQLKPYFFCDHLGPNLSDHLSPPISPALRARSWAFLILPSALEASLWPSFHRTRIPLHWT